MIVFPSPGSTKSSITGVACAASVREKNPTERMTKSLVRMKSPFEQ